MAAGSFGKIAKFLPPCLEIHHGDLEMGRRCGNGVFGTVYRARWKSQSDVIVAVKKVPGLEEKEAQLLSIINHRNIVQFYGIAKRGLENWIVTEYVDNGSLYDFLGKLESGSLLSPDQILQWSTDIASGMNYLHEEAPVRIIHRYLKSKNVLISSDNVLKICDFGTEECLGDTSVVAITGYEAWMAPEVIKHNFISKSCDVYSFGIVLWELVTCEIPYKGLDGRQIIDLVGAYGQQLTIPSTSPPEFAKMITECCETDPKKRPTFRELLRDLEGMCNDQSIYDKKENTPPEGKQVIAIRHSAKEEELDSLADAVKRRRLEEVIYLVTLYPELVNMRIESEPFKRTALQTACYYGHMTIIQALLDNKGSIASLDVWGNTALHHAVLGGHPQVVELLLKLRPDLKDRTNRDGRTALHIAVFRKHIQCVKILLKYKCDVNVQNEDKATALHYALKEEIEEAINILLCVPEIDVTLCTNEYFTVLHYAAEKGNVRATLGILNKTKAIVDVKNIDGNTALHLAAAKNHLNVARILLSEGGCKVDPKNNMDKTPLALAIENSHHDMISLLVEHGERSQLPRTENS